MFDPDIKLSKARSAKGLLEGLIHSVDTAAVVPNPAAIRVSWVSGIHISTTI